MNTALDIRGVGPEIKAALAECADVDGKPMAEIAKSILSEALGVVSESPAERWKRENADAIAAYNDRSKTVMQRMRALSASPIPKFAADQ